MTMSKILFLCLFCTSTMYGLTVDYSPGTLPCGTTTITGNFDCPFSGNVLLSISGGVIHDDPTMTGIVQVVNGEMTLDIIIDAADSSPFVISGVVVASNMPGCAAGSESFSTNVTHNCSGPPANNVCSGAETLTIGDLTCNFASFETSNTTDSGVVPTCGIASYHDLWYDFEANYSEVTIELGTLPGNLAHVAVYDGCGGSQISCTFLFGANRIVPVTGLSEGDTYNIQVRYLPSAAPMGMQQICLYNDFTLAIEDITLSITNHVSYNELNFSSSKEATMIQIERKINEDQSFENIGEIDVEGNSSYKFEDKEIDSKGVYTYRLKIFDIDGASTYSNLVSTRNTEQGSADIKVYPNPSADFINFDLGSYSLDGDFTVEILTADMKSAGAVYNLIDIGSQGLDISDLNNGVYFARVKNTIENQILKFVKI